MKIFKRSEKDIGASDSKTFYCKNIDELKKYIDAARLLKLNYNVCDRDLGDEETELMFIEFSISHHNAQ